MIEILLGVKADETAWLQELIAILQFPIAGRLLRFAKIRVLGRNSAGGRRPSHHCEQLAAMGSPPWNRVRVKVSAAPTGTSATGSRGFAIIRRDTPTFG